MLGLKRSVRARLAATLGFCALLLAAVGGLGVHALNEADSEVEHIYEGNVEPMQALADVRSHLLALQSQLLRATLERSPTATTEAGQQLDAFLETFEQDWPRYLHGQPTGQERVLADRVIEERQTLEGSLERYRELLNEGRFDQALTLGNERLQPGFTTLSADLTELMNAQAAKTLSAYQAGQAAHDAQRWVILSLLGVALLALGLAGWRLTRGIIRPLNRACDFSAEIARGHLDARIEHRYQDEFGRMLNALAGMRDRLVEIVSQARRNAETVSATSAQLASSSDELSQRTQEQAASLEETAASMEEMTATVRQNADNAEQADQLASGVRAQAVAGGEVAGRAVSAMEDIHRSSQQIAEFITMIDGIAFQTNLLALNAAVEAARAGEQGRGFAVVAGEVRNLASRSAEAAREVKSLVETSVHSVENGSQLVRQSGEALAEIVTSVRRTTDIVSEMALANREQSTGIDQVNLAVSQMDEITQRNATMVEQAAEASRLLQEQAEALLERMAFFRLEHAGSELTPATAMGRTKRLAAVKAANNEHSPRIRSTHPAKGTSSQQHLHRPQASSSRTSTTEDEWESF
ncbi:methyl-accepting chemotaxis protein [Kushneria phosphatilytica]|uniref:HAMP domain-containing protein n=1 Tax=Kushneria phosphatilytica TaxID=657387 RepID=A0A1S1NSG4_9GAMM|nr:methyl-accepting chemotaxis protein [Kushneria phosphatilytica]OHV08418.1 hypothetical protein BH688_14020 [Kushneria phosphatilytica]QEL09843.1 HAMP domain-containing protein [Kushneria phosphatilytica]